MPLFLLSLLPSPIKEDIDTLINKLSKERDISNKCLDDFIKICKLANETPALVQVVSWTEGQEIYSELSKLYEIC